MIKNLFYGKQRYTLKTIRKKPDLKRSQLNSVQRAVLIRIAQSLL